MYVNMRYRYIKHYYYYHYYYILLVELFYKNY